MAAHEDQLQVIAAFADGERVDARELRAALADEAGREYLIELVAMREIVRDIADGWMMLRTPLEELPGILAGPGWGARPLTVMRVIQIIAAPTREQAIAQARVLYDELMQSPLVGMLGSFEDFVAKEVVGDPQDCVRRIRELEALGVNYLLARFTTPQAQAAAGRLLLPLLRQ